MISQLIFIAKEKIKEGLIKSARAIRERFSVTTRRDFVVIIVFISRNPNEIVTGNIREAPQTHLISASLSHE